MSHYLKWYLSVFLRLLARLLIVWPALLVTFIPAIVYDLVMRFDSALSVWWIE